MKFVISGVLVDSWKPEILQITINPSTIDLSVQSVIFLNISLYINETGSGLSSAVLKIQVNS
jgi:hypothetical protein